MIPASEAGARAERILVVRLSAMGDVIHTLPAACALREAFPQAMIGWVIEERWAELLCAPGTPRRGPRSPERPLVDWVHAVNLREWGRTALTLWTAQQAVRVWNDIRAARYDVALDLQGAIRSAVLASWSGAPAVWGAADPREAPASLWYTRRAVTHGTHVVRQNVSIAEAAAGRPLLVPSVDLPRSTRSEDHVDRLLAEIGGREFAILNPGAGWGAKCWPADRYGEVAKALAADGLRSIVNYGPGEEELARATESASAGAATAMKCTISELIALTRRASLFIGGDTGPLHLAAALRLPVVGIFGPTDPARNGPFGTHSIVLRNPASPTTHARRTRPDEGLLRIEAEAVVEAARTLLAHSEGGGQKCPPHTGGAHG